MKYFILYCFATLLLLFCIAGADFRRDTIQEDVSVSYIADRQLLDDEVILNVCLPDMQGYMERPSVFNIREISFNNLKNQLSLLVGKIIPARKDLLSILGQLPAEKCFYALLGTRYMSGFYIYCLRQIII